MSVYIIAASLRSLWDKVSFRSSMGRMIKPLWGGTNRLLHWFLTPGRTQPLQDSSLGYFGELGADHNIEDKKKRTEERCS